MSDKLPAASGLPVWTVPVMICLVLLLGIAGIFMLPDAQEAEANRDYARAAAYEAKAELENVRQAGSERMFMLWTTALMAFRDDTIIIILLLALAGAAGFLVSELRKRPPPS